MRVPSRVRISLLHNTSTSCRDMNKIPTIRTVLLLLFGGLLGTAPPVSAQQVTVSTSGQYSSGDYIFTERTEAFVWTTGLTARHGRVQAGINMHLLVQSTPWVTYTGVGPTPSGGPQHGAVGGSHRGPQRGRRSPIALPDTASVRTAGLGDPQLRASIDVLQPEGPGLTVQVTGMLKPPLADADEGFSTGAWDGGVGLSLSHPFFPWFVSAEAAYWWLGDLDELPLKENVAYSAAVGRLLGNGRWGLLASISGSTTVIEDVDPPVSVTSGVSFSHPTGWGLNATLSAGLTEGAADVSIGAGATVTFGN